MQKTVFKGIELIVSDKVDEYYTDALDKHGIEYKEREVVLSRVIPASWTEIRYISPKTGKILYAYECVFADIDTFYSKTFISEHKFSDTDIDELDIVMKNLEYEDYIVKYNKFEGFERGYLPLLNMLVGKYIEYNYKRYEFYKFQHFPEGVYAHVFSSEYNDYRLEEQLSDVFFMPLGGEKDNYSFVMQIAGNLPKIIDYKTFIEMFGKMKE